MIRHVLRLTGQVKGEVEDAPRRRVGEGEGVAGAAQQRGEQIRLGSPAPRHGLDHGAEEISDPDTAAAAREGRWCVVGLGAAVGKAHANVEKLLFLEYLGVNLTLQIIDCQEKEYKEWKMEREEGRRPD